MFLNEKHKTENPNYEQNTIVQLHFNTPYKLGGMSVVTSELWQNLGNSRGCSQPSAKDDHPAIVPTSYLPPGRDIKTSPPLVTAAHGHSIQFCKASSSFQQWDRVGSWGQPYLKSRQLNSLHCQPARMYFILSISPEFLIVSITNN